MVEMSEVLPEVFMHCFGKTEVLILVQLNFISLNYALFLNYFNHFTRLILRKSKTFTGFSFGRHVIKVSFKLSMLLLTPAGGCPSFPAHPLHFLVLRLLQLATPTPEGFGCGAQM